jgi:hypothetical protein
MTAPVPPPTEPDASARICPGDQIGPCAVCHRPTHKRPGQLTRRFLPHRSTAFASGGR